MATWNCQCSVRVSNQKQNNLPCSPSFCPLFFRSRAILSAIPLLTIGSALSAFCSVFAPLFPRLFSPLVCQLFASLFSSQSLSSSLLLAPLFSPLCCSLFSPPLAQPAPTGTIATATLLINLVGESLIRANIMPHSKFEVS